MLLKYERSTLHTYSSSYLVTLFSVTTTKENGEKLHLHCTKIGVSNIVVVLFLGGVCLMFCVLEGVGINNLSCQTDSNFEGESNMLKLLIAKLIKKNMCIWYQRKYIKMC